MATHDYVLADAAGAAFRADANNVLAAIVSNNSNATDPSPTFAYMWWADTTAGLLKLRNAANSAWITIGTLASANLGHALLSSNLFTGLQAEAEGAAVASAGTIDIWATDGNTRHITGSTGPITSMGTAPQAGVWMKLIFDSTPTLTQGANLNLNGGGSDIVIEAGDVAFVYADTTTQLDVFVIRKSGAAVVSGSLGQCRLTLSAGSLKLSPYNGNKLTVNGVTCTIPDAGVTLAATGLSATTLYYIYATQSGGAINALEASVTGHSTDTAAGNKGVEIKTGDSTRTLVGMAYVKTAATFADSESQRFVISWFNRRTIVAAKETASDRTTTSASFVEMSSADRAEFVSWADEQTIAYGKSTTTVSLAGQSGYIAVAVDTTFATGSQTRQIWTAGTSTLAHAIPAAAISGLAEGYHYVTLNGAVGGGATLTVTATHSSVGATIQG